MQSFKELTVWQKSMDLVEQIYQITGQFPKIEQYGLVVQMRRAAVSIPSNIAEGYRRKNRREYLQFLHIATGSAGELETQILLTKRLYAQYDYGLVEQLLDEAQRMLYVLIVRLQAA